MKHIQTVTPQGVVFVDEDEEEGFINFAACYDAYLARRTRSRIRRWFIKRGWVRVPWKEGGQRDNGAMQGTPPVITFYTDPPARFTFVSLEDYEKARNAIWQAGWQTFDLS